MYNKEDILKLKCSKYSAAVVALIFYFFYLFLLLGPHTHLNEPCTGLSKINLGNVYENTSFVFLWWDNRHYTARVVSNILYYA